MTNAIERFASEYELYCQDIASGTLDEDNLDSAQGRVFNVTQVTDRAGISALEVDDNTIVSNSQLAIYRDTKYPANIKTAKAIIENYTKTSSSTYEPKQSDMCYWYCASSGTIVVAPADASRDTLNALVKSGIDAQGNPLGDDSKWFNLTTDTPLDASPDASLPVINVCDICGSSCNKKVYDDTKLVQWNTKIVHDSHNPRFAIAGMPFIKISNLTPSQSEMLGAVGVLDDLGWEVEMEMFFSVPNLEAYINAWGGLAFPVCIVHEPGEYTYDGETVYIPEPGIYFMDAYQQYEYEGDCTWKDK